MQTKLCRGCQTEKPLDGFHKRGTSGTQAKCKECSIAARIEYYRNNKDAEMARNLKNQREFAVWRRSLKEGKPCSDCDVVFHFAAMQWDHREGEEKHFDVANGRPSKARVLAEIEKCDLVCANCHAVRTYTRKQHTGP